MSLMKISLGIILLFLVFTGTAYAYLDPGTGSYILQVLLEFLLAIFFAVKMFFTKIKTFFKKNNNNNRRK